jgi:glycosyltransferase involved in cell wall biosynthesis
MSKIQMNLIIVIVPTYNRKSSLKECVYSVLNQSYDNFELLIMDDGSTDGTAEIVKDFKDNRIIYEWNENSGGPANPRNRGVLKSKGEYVAFLDADDLWYQDKLLISINALNSGMDVVYHDVDYKCDNESKPIASKNINPPVLSYLLTNGNPMVNSSVVVRKRILQKVGLQNESIEYASVEDFDYWLRISKLTNKFFRINKILGQYTVHEEGISNNYEHIEKSIHVIKKYQVDLNEKDEQKSKSLIRYIQGNFFYDRGMYRESRDLYFKTALDVSTATIKLKSIVKYFNSVVNSCR